MKRRNFLKVSAGSATAMGFGLAGGPHIGGETIDVGLFRLVELGFDVREGPFFKLEPFPWDEGKMGCITLHEMPESYDDKHTLGTIYHVFLHTDKQFRLQLMPHSIPEFL